MTLLEASDTLDDVSDFLKTLALFLDGTAYCMGVSEIDAAPIHYMALLTHDHNARLAEARKAVDVVLDSKRQERIG